MSATALALPPPRLERFRRPAEHLCFGAVPAVLSVVLLLFEIHIRSVAVDFHYVYYGAAERLLHGGNPYAVSAIDVASARSFVYPALAALLYVPFALLGRIPGEVVVTLLCFLSVPAALRALEVRDWRIYGLVMLWPPVYTGWETANLSLPFALLVALAWRYRERPVVAGLITAVAISLKPFVWPLALWLVATRRWRASAWTVAIAVVINLVAWSVVGFGRIADFVRMSGRDTDAMWHDGYSVVAALHHLSLTRATGEVALVIASAIVALLVLRSGLLRRDDRRALALAVVLMLFATPLVWPHYLALLLVPLALARPRLGLVWAAPLLMWDCPPTFGVHGWQLAIVWVAGGLCVRASLTGLGGSMRAAGVIRDRLSASGTSGLPKA